jgi:hypothetical protein
VPCRQALRTSESEGIRYEWSFDLTVLLRDLTFLMLWRQQASGAERYLVDLDSARWRLDWSDWIAFCRIALLRGYYDCAEHGVFGQIDGRARHRAILCALLHLLQCTFD